MENIILIGFMGCGKSSVGKRLAGSLGMDFIDTDELIEEKQKRTISDIFAQDGERAFRDMETQCLHDLLEEERNAYVLSVGGGFPIREENRQLLSKLGQVVFLQVTPDVVYKRLQNDTTRPLLQGKNPRGRIADLMNARREYYEAAASYIIDVSDKSFTDIIGEIVNVCGKETI